MGIQKVSNEPAFVLHSYPYRETSLIVDLLTRDYGRVAVVAKGARRPRSALRAVLLGFQPLSVTFLGKNELRTLSQAEWMGGMHPPEGRALLCAFYLNELVLKFVPRDDPHQSLFDAYQLALHSLGEGKPVEPILRRFEWTLLRESGYAPDFNHDRSGAPIQLDRHYQRLQEVGWELLAVDAPRTTHSVSGQVLQQIANFEFDEPEAAGASKQIMRSLLAEHLQGQSLKTRQILMELQRHHG
jgi:DNA repair protein RecO (recombination protein O)